jgi:hypothetical protein
MSFIASRNVLSESSALKLSSKTTGVEIDDTEGAMTRLAWAPGSWPPSYILGCSFPRTTIQATLIISGFTEWCAGLQWNKDITYMAIKIYFILFSISGDHDASSRSPPRLEYLPNAISQKFPTFPKVSQIFRKVPKFEIIPKISEN